MTTEAPFRLLRAFNDPALQAFARKRIALHERALPFFAGDTLADHLVRAIAARRALSVKEMLESFEMYAAVRRPMRCAAIADLCAGHGLTGLLFAAFERTVESVTLIDQAEPKAHALVRGAILAVAPWAAAKIRYVEGELETAAEGLAPGTGVVAVHACGELTDRCLEIGLRLGGPIALMPCCHDHDANPGPFGLRAALGGDVALDVQRTYRMEAAGLRVRWVAVPSAITPKNRVLVARR